MPRRLPLRAWLLALAPALLAALVLPRPRAEASPAPAGRVLAPALAATAARADTAALAPRPMRSVSELPSFWYTRAERTGYRATATYGETVDYLRRLAAASRWLSVQPVSIL